MHTDSQHVIIIPKILIRTFLLPFSLIESSSSTLIKWSYDF